MRENRVAVFTSKRGKTRRYYKFLGDYVGWNSRQEDYSDYTRIMKNYRATHTLFTLRSLITGIHEVIRGYMETRSILENAKFCVI